jgi:hypothetical protein
LLFSWKGVPGRVLPGLDLEERRERRRKKKMAASAKRVKRGMRIVARREEEGF